MTDPSPTTPPPRTSPALRFDWRDWLPYLEDEDIPEDQKRELIERLWSIVVCFVDLGWSVSSDPLPSGEEFDLKAVLEAAAHNSDVADEPVNRENAL